MCVSAVKVEDNYSLYFIFQPADCKVLIDKLKECSNNESKLYQELRQIQAWTYGKVRDVSMYWLMNFRYCLCKYSRVKKNSVFLFS